MNLNKVHLAGNITRDPELKKTNSGQSVCEISLAINHRYKTSAGVEKDEVVFIGAILWAKVAESFARHVRKGQNVYLEGRITQDKWDDKNTGEKRTKTKIVVNEWQFCGRKEDGGNRAEPTPATQLEAAPVAATNEAAPEEDSVPF